jgi:hypothetical protein
MSKADSSPSTAAPAPKSRRAVILGAGGIAAAGALLTLPAVAAGAKTEDPSPEILEYRRCLAAHLACFIESHDEDEAWEARVAETGDAKEETIEAILARPCRSWQDVVELAEVVRDELWNTEEPDNWYVHSHHGGLEPALMKAIFAVAKGLTKSMTRTSRSCQLDAARSLSRKPTSSPSSARIGELAAERLS